MNSKDDHYGPTTWAALNKALEGGIPAGDKGLDADFDGNSDGINVMVVYAAEMSEQFGDFLDSPMPKERWKQRKPMYQKKAKKEVKLHSLLGCFDKKRG